MILLQRLIETQCPQSLLLIETGTNAFVHVVRGGFYVPVQISGHTNVTLCRCVIVFEMKRAAGQIGVPNPIERYLICTQLARPELKVATLSRLSVSVIESLWKYDLVLSTSRSGLLHSTDRLQERI